MHEGSWCKWWDSSKHYTAFREALNSYPPIFSSYMFHQNPDLDWSSEQQGSNKESFQKQVVKTPKYEIRATKTVKYWLYFKNMEPWGSNLQLNTTFSTLCVQNTTQ